jgi:hypothetical protein
MNQDVNLKSAELFKLLSPHRTSDLMQRITLHVVEKTGKKLPDYINDAESAVEDKITLLDELIKTVESGDFSSLPAAPTGQAGGAVAPAVAAPKPAPKPAAVKPAAPKPAAPVNVPAAVKPTILDVMVAASEPLTEDGEEPTPHTDADADDADPMAIIMAQMKKLAKPQGKQLTEADVRKLVRSELANALSLIVGALNK